MNQHVVIGAGAVGSATAMLLAQAGERVRVVTRSGGGPDHALVDRVRLDAADAGALAGACDGAVAVYNCANPPYHRWQQDWPPIAAALLRAAERTGAVLATCSNLYGYGVVDRPMTEDLPLAATGVKGRVRARMWQDALDAHRAGRIRATEVRGSDYVGPRGTQSQLGDAMIGRLLRGRSVWLLGDPAVPHSWTYIGDVARTLVVVARDQRAWGRPWHVPTNPAVPALDLVAQLCRAAGVQPVAVHQLPGWLMATGRHVSPTVRELREVMHQHVRPWVLDSSAAERELGVRPTAWDDVLRAIVDDHRRPAAEVLSA